MKAYMIIENITKEAYLSHLKFKLERSQQRRNISLMHLLPVDDGVSYCVYITDLLLNIKNSEMIIQDFDLLFKTLNLERSHASLEKLRCDNELIERSHVFRRQLKTMLRE